ncbi:MAG: hypothetical protein JO002_12665, partial [Burkholderiaceae bacterium]|nr:hypothetical protein [Burkholderiaceae bacterium]
MRLYNVARYFEQDAALDAYTAAPLFNCTTSYEDERGANAAAAAAKHFAMYVPHGQAMPARNAVSIFGTVWLIGNSNPDGFMGTPISDAYS